MVLVEHNMDTELAEQTLTADFPFCTSLDVPPTDNSLHWHSFDAKFYIKQGDLVLRDKSGTAHICGPGTMVTVPTKTLHQEFSETGYQIIFGASVLPEDFGDPVDRSPETL